MKYKRLNQLFEYIHKWWYPATIPKMSILQWAVLFVGTPTIRGRPHLWIYTKWLLWYNIGGGCLGCFTRSVVEMDDQKWLFQGINCLLVVEKHSMGKPQSMGHNSALPSLLNFGPWVPLGPLGSSWVTERDQVQGCPGETKRSSTVVAQENCLQIAAQLQAAMTIDEVQTWSYRIRV